ncbi:hypothetical protein [Streptomyces sp. NRRL F-2664]|uniref:hypothetical protein n=1 Tax=Streptomyces sp. NRRL F-2664 TaxID=1463842 RepID=UPI00131BAB15|nr:hypothetical protein [Streptomyces sp. NRRL F-2664]
MNAISRSAVEADAVLEHEFFFNEGDWRPSMHRTLRSIAQCMAHAGDAEAAAELLALAERCRSHGAAVKTGVQTEL